jgi:hypothetical protein
MVSTFGHGAAPKPPPLPVKLPAGQTAQTAQEAEAGLLNGPQLPTLAMDQGDIDKLLASFD